ncbi:glutamate 5-kinase [Stratiformator vulcanicus]|uniref:Glutamate 5-kinase n=1 Tax=Stratiformator vulcanicus TaxID=2527980 RepID=A0A517R091_9PLAN|nr:glutamate 5-kinase [Stratiformator vulcanicus]QDT37316.1 Glutamate 5-kinase [Stratiformator vulcanicus]
MHDLLRKEVYETAETIVVKIGTNALSRADDTLDETRIDRLGAQIAEIRKSGRRVVIVSSGAVGAGLGLLGLTERPKDLPHLQAAAATGQAKLIQLYDQALRPHGIHAAQLLLTANDFKRRRRYLNVRNTIYTLFEYGVVPIINENDTVSVEEIKFGDNDHLAAMVTSLLPNPLLVILSVVDGLFDGDPKSPDAKPIRLVEQIDDDLLGLARAERSSRGTGGMQSKLASIRSVTAVGENVILANGEDPEILDRIRRGDIVGSLFLAQKSILPAWKRWIGYTVKPNGWIVVDDGAVGAVTQKGKSLLPIGVVSVGGSFDSGELISIRDRTGREFARGLSNYQATEVKQIAGCRSDALAERLGSASYAEVVHRNNLAVIA